MPKGIYAAASAMVVETHAQDLIARNLANSQTDGYRRESAVRTSFSEVLKQQGRTGGLDGDGGAGVLDAGGFYHFNDGQTDPTGAPLDLALHGDAFYRVRAAEGKDLLTRAAHFTVDPQGRLVTPQGWPVEGQGGPITIPKNANKVIVDKVGRVSIEVGGGDGGKPEEVLLDQLRVVTVEHPERMRAENGQYFAPGDQAQTDSRTYEVRQGQLERANIDPIHEMVDMIAVQRRYDSAQRALREQANLGGNLSDLLRGPA